jgi:hypothetical protein
LRSEAAGAAHRTQERANAPNPAQTKAGAVLRAGPVWLLHFKNASRSAPHEQVSGNIRLDRKEVKQLVACLALPIQEDQIETVEARLSGISPESPLYSSFKIFEMSKKVSLNSNPALITRRQTESGF